MEHLAGPLFGEIIARIFPGAAPGGDDYLTAQQFRSRYLLAALMPPKNP